MLVGGAGVVVTMPQVKRGARGAGLHLPDVYRTLLEYERAMYDRRGGKVVLVDGREVGKRVPAGVDEHGKEKFFLYPRRDFLNLLEAGETVGVSVGRLEDALWSRDRKRDPSASRPRLPFARGVRRVRVSPDDRIVSAADGSDRRLRI